MSRQIEYGAPRRLNSVTVTLILLLVAGGYWMWRFFPAYFEAWSVDHILKEAASQVYQANRLAEPQRTETLTELINKAKRDIQTKAGVTDPDLVVNLDIDEARAVVSAEYRVIVTHPLVTKTTRLAFKRREEANIKPVNWE